MAELALEMLREAWTRSSSATPGRRVEIVRRDDEVDRYNDSHLPHSAHGHDGEPATHLAAAWSCCS